jgi:hypothetical protein
VPTIRQSFVTRCAPPPAAVRAHHGEPDRLVRLRRLEGPLEEDQAAVRRPLGIDVVPAGLVDAEGRLALGAAPAAAAARAEPASAEALAADAAL